MPATSKKTLSLPAEAAPSRAVAGQASERRGSARQSAHDISEIIVGKRKFAVACMVHNLSRYGALVEAGAGDLPDRFILTNHKKQQRMICQVVWRCGRLLGVKFASQPRQLDLPPAG